MCVVCPTQRSSCLTYTACFSVPPFYSAAFLWYFAWCVLLCSEICSMLSVEISNILYQAILSSTYELSTLLSVQYHALTTQSSTKELSVYTCTFPYFWAQYPSQCSDWASASVCLSALSLSPLKGDLGCSWMEASANWARIWSSFINPTPPIIRPAHQSNL